MKRSFASQGFNIEISIIRYIMTSGLKKYVADNSKNVLSLYAEKIQNGILC